MTSPAHLSTDSTSSASPFAFAQDRGSARRVTIAIALALMVLGIVLRGAATVSLRGFDPEFEGDEYQYHHIAASGIAGTGWVTQRGYSSYRPPMIPAILAGAYAVTGPDSRVGRALMSLIGALAAPLIFLVGGSYFRLRRANALLVAIIWMLYPPAVVFSQWIATENLALLFILSSAALYIRAVRSGTPVDALLTGMAWGFLALTRPNFVLLPITIVAFGVLAKPWLGDRVLPLKRSLMALLVFVAMLAPWTIRNYQLHAKFIPSTTLGATLIPRCNYKLDDPMLQAGNYRSLPEIREIYELPEGEWYAAGFGMTLAHLEGHWPLIFRPVLNRAKNFWTFRPDPYKAHFTANDLIMAAVWLPILALFLLSLIRRSWFDDWLALLIIAYAFVSILPFWGSPRFRFPVEPLIFIQAALVWQSLGWAEKVPRLAKFLEATDRRLGAGRPESAQ